MSEERKFVYMRKTRSGQGVKMRDGEIVYIASIRSLEAFLHGDREFVMFMRFPYRQIPNKESERNTIFTWCEKCQLTKTWIKIGEDKWKCSGCGSEKTTRELILKMRSIMDIGEK